ncbi:MAG TPA: hypothetical protein VFJ74_17240 [Gemmatimonadaceae bacterium]|nr:hypothetical protein [Gemmatimonadaceae bacterium]
MRTRFACAVTPLLAFAIGCTDDPLPSAPRDARPSATLYTATVGPAVALTSLGGTQDVAYGINGAGDVSGWSAGATVLWSTGPAAVPTLGSPVDLGFGRGLDINASGQVAGELGNHAALWTPPTGGGGAYTVTDIGALFPGAIFSTAYALNGGGKVVGSARVPQGAGYVDQCFLWTPTVANGTSGTVSVPANDFGGGFCSANDINDLGTVTGASNLPSGFSHAFVWSGSGTAGITDLTPTDVASYGSAINTGGQVAGWRITSPTPPSVLNATVWTPTSASTWSVTDLGTYGHDQSQAMDINDAGYVIGFARNNTTTIDDAFFWQNGSFSSLASPSGEITSPTGAMSDATSAGIVLVVGGSLNPSSGVRHALRWAVTLTPVSPSSCIAPLMTLITQMQSDGTLRNGEARSLIAKLDAASRQIVQGNVTPARNLFEAFINEVNALVASGRLTAAQAQPLIDGAQCAIAAL